MFNDLLVHLDASEQGERRLDAAIAMAIHLEVRLSGLYVEQPPPAALFAAGVGPAGGGVVDASLHSAMLEPLEQQHREARDRLSKRAAASSADFRWIEAEGAVQAVICDYARCSDLVIIGQEPERIAEGHPDPMPSAGGIVLETGRPVLIVPQDGTCDLPGGHAMVAWNASAEATRALHDALPLLGRCDSVTVQSFVEEDLDDEAIKPGFDVAEHLQRHGIDARFVREHDEGDHGEVLLERARDLGSTLIVMGAYGHSRLREYMFGGVTRHVLANTTVPLLVAH